MNLKLEALDIQREEINVGHPGPPQDASECVAFHCQVAGFLITQSHRGVQAPLSLAAFHEVKRDRTGLVTHGKVVENVSAARPTPVAHQLPELRPCKTYLSESAFASLGRRCVSQEYTSAYICILLQILVESK